MKHPVKNEIPPQHLQVIRERGVALAETLIAIAIVTLLSSIVYMSLQPPAERNVAAAVQSFIQDGRLESMASKSPVVVSYNAAAKQFRSSRVVGEAAAGCKGATQPGRTLELSEFGRVRSTDTEFAVLWLPDGQPRSCSADTAPLDAEDGATFRVSGLSATYTVGVSSDGQVRLY